MKATKRLPQGYEPIYTFDLGKNRRAAFRLNIIALGLFFFFWRLFAFIGAWLRPGSFANAQTYVPEQIISVVVALVAMVILHEGLHGLLFWWFTRERPKFGGTIFYAYAAAPGWYFPRGQYMLIGAAPIVVLSTVGIGVIALISHAILPGLIFFLAINAAGSLGDIYAVSKVWTSEAMVLVEDWGEGFKIYAPTN